MTDERSFFYIIYPLGLVDFGLLELREKWDLHYPESSLDILAVDPGGIYLAATLSEGHSLNHILKTPTRILLRLAEFKARDFPKLFQKVSQLPWKNWLIGQIPEVEVKAINSRLFDSRKIAKAIGDGIAEYYRRGPVKKKYLDFLAQKENMRLPKIYYRAENDVITLSLDTTGELLHKRGEKIYTGHAPLRESLASLLLIALLKHVPKEFRHSPLTLVDPMCGSGTFLIEACDGYHINDARDFAYEATPFGIDDHKHSLFIKNLRSKDHPLFHHFQGYDIDGSVIELAQKNAGTRPIQLGTLDLFSKERAPLNPQGPTLVICNPPYGIRVGEREHINSDYYKNIVGAVKEKFDPLFMGIIITSEHSFKMKGEGLALLAKIPFKNGGLPVVFYVLKMRSA